MKQKFKFIENQPKCEFTDAVNKRKKQQGKFNTKANIVTPVFITTASC